MFNGFLIYLLILLNINLNDCFIDDKSIIIRGLSLTYYNQAQNFLKEKQIQNAIIYYKRSFECYPTSLSADKLAFLFDLSGDHNEFVYWQQLYIKYTSEKLINLINKGILTHYNGNYDAAIEYYDQILAIDSKHTEALYHKGVSYQHLGNIQLSAEYYYSTLQLNPIHIKSIVNLATLHHRYGSIDEAIDYYILGIETFERINNYSYVVNKSIMLTAMDRIDYLHIHNIMILSNLAVAFLQQHSLEEVIYIYINFGNKES